MTVTLTIRGVATAARKAYDEGRLCAQRAPGECLYRGSDDSVCAIGAALSDDDLAALSHKKPSSLDLNQTALKQLAGWTSDDPHRLVDLQLQHDFWSQGAISEAQFLAGLAAILGRPRR